MNKTTILVATHKPYSFPNDTGYLPIQVGKESSSVDLKIQGDNTGNNISYKNHNYCELTALYWAWKNLDSEYVGLVHYRRHFKSVPSISAIKVAGKSIASSQGLENILLQNNVDILLPRKRNYLIESIETHYKNAHYAEDLKTIKQIIKSSFPSYLNDFNMVLNSNSASMFNMFVTKKKIADEYASWLFKLLEEAEKEIDLSNRSLFQQRAYGFLSEILLNVWVQHKALRVKRLPIVHLEGENLVKKGYQLILRKLIKDKKYDG